MHIFSLSLHIPTRNLENINITFGKSKCCYSESWRLLPTHSPGHLPSPWCRCELESTDASWRADRIPCASEAPQDFCRLCHSVSRKQFSLPSPSNLQDFLEFIALERVYCSPTLLSLTCTQSTTSSDSEESPVAPLWLLSQRTWIDPLTAWLVKHQGILKRKFSPDSQDGSFPGNFIGVVWISKHIEGVNIKNSLPAPKEQKRGNQGDGLCPQEMHSF